MPCYYIYTYDNVVSVCMVCLISPLPPLYPHYTPTTISLAGTLGVTMNMDGSGENTARPSSRAGNEVAQSLAARNRGTLGNFIFGGG